MSKIIMAVGGSGGHVLPAIALAKQLQSEVLFVGVDLNHNPYIKHASVHYHSIKGDTISKNMFKLFKASIKIIKGFSQSLKILKKTRPDLVVGFGSFHTFPVLLAALFYRLPIVLYAPDASLGVVNRLFFPVAKKVGMYFPLAHTKVEKLKMECAKTPLTQEEARAYFGLDPHIPTLLVFGGSQGALPINAFILGLINRLNVQIIHFVGFKENLEAIKEKYKTYPLKVCVKQFEEKMDVAYKAATFAFTRAGAGTIKELIANNVPAIVVPYPYAKLHQLENGKFFADIVKGGYCILQQHLQEKGLKCIEQLYTEIDLFRKNIEQFHQKNEGAYLHQMINKVLGSI